MRSERVAPGAYSGDGPHPKCTHERLRGCTKHARCSRIAPPSDRSGCPMLKAGDVILLCVLSLLCIGVLMVNSASLSVGAEEGVTFQSIALGRSTQFAAIAFALLLVSSRLPSGPM